MAKGGGGGQVRALGVEEGEERRVRGALRRMEARRSAVERCSLARAALGGDGGVGDALTAVEGHLRGVLAQEEAAAARAQGALATCLPLPVMFGPHRTIRFRVMQAPRVL